MKKRKGKPALFGKINIEKINMGRINIGTINMGRIRKGIKIFALAAVLMTQTAVCTMVSYGVVYLYDDSDEDKETQDDRLPIRSRTSTGTSRSTREEEDSQENRDENGPGGRETEEEMETNSVILESSLINQVTLKEQYHQDYKVYEESLADLFFFYSNVGNGGITHEPVTLDIPMNLSYTVEWNGVPWEYVSGQPISNYGTYVVRLTGIEDTSVPLYEQKEYQAVFRFRIQAKPPEEETKEESQGSGTGSSQGTEWRSYTYDGRPIEDNGNEDILDAFRVNAGAGTSSNRQASGENSSNRQGTEESSANRQGSEEGSANRQGAEESSANRQGTEESSSNRQEPEEGIFSGQESLGTGEDGALEGEAAGQDGQENGGTGEGSGMASNSQGLSGEEGLEGRESGQGNTGFIPRIQTYDSGTKMYHVTFPDGLELVSSVPEGYIGPNSVELSVSPGARESMVLYRDDEEIEYTSGEALTQPGNYRLELNGQPWSCTIAAYLRQSDVYAAPAGMGFSSATVNGEPLELSSQRYVLLEEDGEYQFVLEGGDGALLTTILTKDTQPPQVEVTVRGGNASIQYLSDDVGEIRLEKDGEAVEGFSGYAVTRPGTYKLTVLDKAGNEAVSEFTLTYHINRYGIIAVVLILLLVIAGVVFVVHMKKTVRVR